MKTLRSLLAAILVLAAGEAVRRSTPSRATPSRATSGNSAAEHAATHRSHELTARAEEEELPAAPLELSTPTVGTPLLVPGCSGTVGPRSSGPAAILGTLLAELGDRARNLLADSELPLETRQALIAVLQPGADHHAALDILRVSPHRDQDGFDLAVAAAVAAGSWSLRQEHPDAADAWARELDALAPEAAYAALLRFHAASERNDARSAGQALEDAFARASEEPSISLGLAGHRLREGDAEGARVALGAYLEVVDDDEWALALRERIDARARLLHELEDISRDGVVLLHDVGEARAGAIHDTVLRALDDAASLTRTPRRATLTITIYPSRDAFLRSTCGPSWSGGLYDGAIHLPPSTARSPAAQSTIRHEVLHAQLGTLGRSIPVWFQEGIAQHFEGRRPPDLERSLRRMRDDRTYVPFGSLEGSFTVIDDPADARFAYHQSYAMIAAALERDRGAIAHGVEHLRRGGSLDALLGALGAPPLSGDLLLAWIAKQDLGPL